MCHDLYRQVFAWTVKGQKNITISDDEVKFIRKHSGHNRKDPYEYLSMYFTKFTNQGNLEHQYLLDLYVQTAKVSVCITNPIGKWVDVKLQSVAQSTKTYLKDSFELKRSDQEHVPLTPHVRLFIFDAVSMYTNILTYYVLEINSKYLRDSEGRFD